MDVLLMRGYDVEVYRHTSATVRACSPKLFLVVRSVDWSTAGARTLQTTA